MLYSTILLALATSAAAHMRLATPTPLGNPQDIDYLGPLERFNEQAPFPCRGHLPLLSSSPGAQATWAAGSQQYFTLSGDTPHYGGSSQASLSYDEGKTWKAIKSFPGSCPNRNPTDDQTFTFTVPKEAKAGETVLFSWSWFNREQEMYHNCAHVAISNEDGNAPGLDAFPDMLVADIKETTCWTPRTNAETLFPNMGEGDQVEYGDGEYPLELPAC